jgi:uncharacterized damage-inducible protein DinB
MSNLSFCIERRKAERPAFVRVLRAMPAGRLDYRPDPKSRSAAELASLLAAEEASLVSLLDSGAIDWKEEKPSTSLDQIVATFEKSAAAVDERLAKLDEAAWKKPGKFLMGGQAVWEDSVGNMMWGMLFDAIHHRGQLSTYLRPMGGKVPSIYGPSADDPGQ